MVEARPRFDETTPPVANVATGWKRQPSGVANGTRTTGISAALWRHNDETRQEVVAEPNAAMHSMGITTTSFRKETFVDGRRIFHGVLRAGSCNLIRAGERPRGVLTGRWGMLHIYVPDALLKRVVDYEDYSAGYGSLELISPGWAHDETFARIGADIQAEMIGTHAFSQLKLDALGIDFAIHLLRNYSNFADANSHDRPKRGGLASWQVKRACEALESKLDGSIALEQLAALVGLSPTYFSRAFKQSTSHSPFEWLRLQRIERAKQLLSGSKASLSDVAQQVGFSAQPQFTTAFKRSTGTTPARWRKDRL